MSTPTHSLDQMSALRCAQRYEKVYYLPDETFKGSAVQELSNLVRKKWLVRATKRGPVWGFHDGWGGGWELDTVWELIWFESPAGTEGKGTQAFLSSFPDEGHKGRRKVKSCHHTSKVASDSSLQWGSSGFHSVGAPRENSPPFHCFHLKLKEKFLNRSPW